ncbi:MAG TPA: hypothetical protein VF787_25040 [Thermoanaerobaculia bacterium]
MPVVDRLLARYRLVPRPIPHGDSVAINGAVRLPLKQNALQAMVGNKADALVPLINTSQKLRALVLTMMNHPLHPDDVMDLMVKINLLRPNAATGAQDVVVGFNNLSNSTQFLDPTMEIFMEALEAVLNEPVRGVPLTNFIRHRTFDALRQLVRNVERRFLADAFRVMADFHNTPHVGQLTQASMPSWAKVLHYAPPNGMVSAAIRFNPALLADHVRKHLCYQRIGGVLIPDADEPCRWIDFLDCADRITFNWVLSCTHISDEEEAEIFDARGNLMNTLEAKQAFVRVLRRDDALVDEYRITKRVERDYERIAIRTVQHGRKFVHYTPGGDIFITGSLNGVYVMAKFVPLLGEFAISTAYLPDAGALQEKLAQWQPSTVWNLA